MLTGLILEMERNDDIEYTATSDEPRKGKRWTKILVALLLLLLVGSTAGAYFLLKDSGSAKADLKDANGQITALQREVNGLKSQLDTTSQSLYRERIARTKLQLENDTLKTLFPLYISTLEVANADGKGNSISSYGKDISASSSMYLMPRITYLGMKVGDTIELMVRLYDHENKLVTGANSPAGYSFSCKVGPIMPNENTVSLSGWGGADKGHFKPGTYRYEVWYNDMCLKQCVFRLK